MSAVWSDSIVAVAAPDKHSDIVWLIIVDEVEKALYNPIVDGYGNILAPGQQFLSDHFFGAHSE